MSEGDDDVSDREERELVRREIVCGRCMMLLWFNDKSNGKHFLSIMDPFVVMVHIRISLLIICNKLKLYDM
jgi:hypothetical protein